ncbi:MAG: LysR family transcriptional regulator [Acetobacteraceae bacterium]|nr:LysR family transcriptional regulator [Acetobacteraceae bacterium]
MDRLDELAVFLAVLDTGSLAGAARRLRRSPPAVTRILAGLEARAGARLIERTTRTLAPTEAGRHLAEQARHLLADYEEAMRAVAGGEQAVPRGLLRVTAPIMFGQRHVTPLVASFLAAHPALRAELILSDRNLDLVEEGLDVAVRIGALPDSGLIARRVGEVRRVLVASPAYLAARGSPAVPADLARHEVVFTASRPGPLEWRFRRGGAGSGREQAVRLAPRLVVSHVEAALAAALEGHGIAAALSYQVDAEIRAGRLVRLLPEYELPAVPVHLLVPSARLMPARVRLFLDHAAARLSRLEVIRDGWWSAPDGPPPSATRCR